MADTSHSSPPERPWYPQFVSDRADALIAELGAAQCQLLFDALRTTSVAQWLGWIEDARAVIGTYDALAAKQRTRRLQDRADSAAPALQHACVFLELWRARMEGQYWTLPPRGTSLEDPEARRGMLLAALAAYRAHDVRDLWPFEWHRDDSWRPPFVDFDPD